MNNIIMHIIYIGIIIAGFYKCGYDIGHMWGYAKGQDDATTEYIKQHKQPKDPNITASEMDFYDN